LLFGRPGIAKGKKNVRATCPKGKLELKCLSSPEDPKLSRSSSTLEEEEEEEALLSSRLGLISSLLIMKDRPEWDASLSRCYPQNKMRHYPFVLYTCVERGTLTVVVSVLLNNMMTLPRVKLVYLIHSPAHNLSSLFVSHRWRKMTSTRDVVVCLPV